MRYLSILRKISLTYGKYRLQLRLILMSLCILEKYFTTRKTIFLYLKSISELNDLGSFCNLVYDSSRRFKRSKLKWELGFRQSFKWDLGIWDWDSQTKEKQWNWDLHLGKFGKTIGW